MITLRAYEHYDYHSLTRYELPEEQAIYTSLPINALIDCEKDQAKAPIVICFENKIIGFFVLAIGESANRYTTNQLAVVFQSFSIDKRYQGKHFAVHSLHLLPSFIRKRYPHHNEIILTVHHTNVPARNLYHKCGFHDNGFRYEGEYGEEFIYHRSLV